MWTEKKNLNIKEILSNSKIKILYYSLKKIFGKKKRHDNFFKFFVK